MDTCLPGCDVITQSWHSINLMLGISLFRFLPFVHGCTPLFCSLQEKAMNIEMRVDNQ
jgi:hypothetical protein